MVLNFVPPRSHSCPEKKQKPRATPGTTIHAKNGLAAPSNSSPKIWFSTSQKKKRGTETHSLLAVAARIKPRLVSSGPTSHTSYINRRAFPSGNSGRPRHDTTISGFWKLAGLQPVGDQPRRPTLRRSPTNTLCNFRIRKGESLGYYRRKNL